MKKILVTGGAGYIGSKIVSDLIKRKYKVYIVDNLSSGHKLLINKKALFFKINIGDKSKINKLLKKNNITSIVHCAAYTNVDESQKNPRKYINNNLVNTKRFLDTCVKNNLKYFVFSSTCAVYGKALKIVNENSVTKPTSVYGKTKLDCEKIIKSFSKKFNFKYGILRYFNVVGSDIQNRIGPINNNNQLIKNLSLSVVNKINKISIYGKNYNTRDGTCVRDYIYVGDISKIHIKLLQLLYKKNKSFLFNCGYGRGYSVLEIINKFEKIFKVKFKKYFKPKRKGEIIEIISSNKKINKLIKIKEGNSRLNKIIISSVKWEKYLKKN